MRYQKGAEKHQVHHLDLYIRSGMGSNESDTHDSLQNTHLSMQPKDGIVICTQMSPYG